MRVAGTGTVAFGNRFPLAVDYRCGHCARRGEVSILGRFGESIRSQEARMASTVILAGKNAAAMRPSYWDKRISAAYLRILGAS